MNCRPHVVLFPNRSKFLGQLPANEEQAPRLCWHFVVVKLRECLTCRIHHLEDKVALRLFNNRAYEKWT